MELDSRSIFCGICILMRIGMCYGEFNFPIGGSQVSNRVILNYYIRSVILGHVKERKPALAKSRERKNREEVDRCGCQAGLHEECEIRVLLRETRGRFKDGNIFRRETIFAFTYITSYAYTLRCRISCTTYYLYLYFMPEMNFESEISISVK